MNLLEVRFPIAGTLVPADHGYALFAALSRRIPAIHSSHDFSFDTLKGKLQHNSCLWLKADAQLKIRAPQNLISPLLKLEYQELQLGQFAIRLGMPDLNVPRPSSSLYARIVTIKNHQEPSTFTAAVRAKLDAQNIGADIEVGKRRVVKMSNHTIVGFSLRLHNLSNASSLLLLQKGLGGRRHVGCSFFQGISPAFINTRARKAFALTDESDLFTLS